jgi:hypothetical protein
VRSQQKAGSLLLLLLLLQYSQNRCELKFSNCLFRLHFHFALRLLF